MNRTIAVCVPSSVTEVEKRAVEDATRQAGARRVHIIEEPIAAAIGSGIDISRACGSMVVDIGGGTTDIAVISLGGTVVSYSLKIAGDNFDDAIIRYIRKKHNVLIGERTAEDLKIKIGTAFERTSGKHGCARQEPDYGTAEEFYRNLGRNAGGIGRIRCGNRGGGAWRSGENTPELAGGYLRKRDCYDGRRQPCCMVWIS